MKGGAGKKPPGVLDGSREAGGSAGEVGGSPGEVVCGAGWSGVKNSPVRVRLGRRSIALGLTQPQDSATNMCGHSLDRVNPIPI